MRKLTILLLLTGLVAGSLAAPAAAKKRAKPQKVTFYLHGPFPAGEVDYVESTANEAQGVPDGFQVMDGTEPTDAAPDSMGLTNYVRGPNRQCSGNALFPTWEGKVAGKITGDMTVYLHAVGPNPNVFVEVFADGMGGCTSVTGSQDYVEPVARTTAALNPDGSTTEVVLKGVDFATLAHMVLMVSPGEADAGGQTVLSPENQGRILYDAADYVSRIEFTCTPTTGKSCLP